jgi:hypothetical protein
MQLLPPRHHFLPNKYETSRYPKAASTSRRGSSAIVITEITKMSGRGFGDLCSVISEWSQGENARGKYQNRGFSQGMPECLHSWQTSATVTAQQPRFHAHVPGQPLRPGKPLREGNTQPHEQQNHSIVE